MPSFRQRLKPRLAAFGVIILIVLGVLLIRLWSMQVIAGEAFAKQADDNRVRKITTEAPRGRILDRKGRELVSNRATLAVLVEPRASEDTTMLVRLSTVLGMPMPEIKEKIASKREAALAARVVAIDVPMDVAAYLSEHESEFPGVTVDSRAVRKYPQGKLAAHVLGYTGLMSENEAAMPQFEGYQMGDVVGKTGAEAAFEKALQGDRGYRRVQVDARGRQRGVLEEVDPVPGRDVKLTIDADVQRVAEAALQAALKDAHRDNYNKARAGAAVAIDVKTGEVIAMASAPNYNPDLFLNGISEKDWKALTKEGSEYPLTNRAIMAQYPPASTFKAFTGLAGLDSKIVAAGSTVNCQGKWTGLGVQWKKYCWKHSGHGYESFVEGIRDSCDAVFYEIGKDFYNAKGEPFQTYVRRFGFGSKTGIELPGEADGRVPDAAWKKAYNEDYPEYQQWQPGDTVNMAIGQGDLLVTPLQLAAGYSGIANGGKVIRPHMLRQILGSDGKPVYAEKPRVAFDSKAKPANLATMRSALELVTESGTAKGAFRGFGVPVAGKTGTAQVYGKDDYAWFVGFAPAAKPKYCVVVVVEQGGHGGSVAAPAARDILAKLLGEPVRHVSAQDTSR